MHLLPNSNAQVATGKGMWAAKLTFGSQLGLPANADCFV